MGMHIMKTSTRISLVIRVMISITSMAFTIAASVLEAREHSIIGVALCVHGVIGIFAPLASAAACLRADEPATTESWLIDIIVLAGPAVGTAIVGALMWNESPTYARVGTIISAAVVLSPMAVCILIFICSVFVNCAVWCKETYHIVLDREFHEKTTAYDDTTAINV